MRILRKLLASAILLPCFVAYAGDCTTSTADQCNRAPVCSSAIANIDTVWPLPVEVLGVTDPDGDPVTITVDSIYQDEPIDTFADGSIIAVGQSADNDRLTGEGRMVQINFTAADGNGGRCTGNVSVCLPHDRGKNSNCVGGKPTHKIY